MSQRVATFYEYVNESGRKYYYDAVSGLTTYKFPLDAIVRDPKTKAVLYAPAGANVAEDSPPTTETAKKKPTGMGGLKRDGLRRPMGLPPKREGGVLPSLPKKVETTTKEEEDKGEMKPEEKTEDKTEEKTGEKPVEEQKEKTEEKPEENTEEKPVEEQKEKTEETEAGEKAGDNETTQPTESPIVQEEAKPTEENQEIKAEVEVKSEETVVKEETPVAQNPEEAEKEPVKPMLERLQEDEPDRKEEDQVKEEEKQKIKEEEEDKAEEVIIPKEIVVTAAEDVELGDILKSTNESRFSKRLDRNTFGTSMPRGRTGAAVPLGLNGKSASSTSFGTSVPVRRTTMDGLGGSGVMATKDYFGDLTLDEKVKSEEPKKSSLPFRRGGTTDFVPKPVKRGPILPPGQSIRMGARVKIPFTPQELMCLTYGMSILSSQSEIQAKLDEFRYEDFVLTHYTLRKKNRRTYVLAKMNYRKNCLKKPILIATPKSLKKQAIGIFKAILDYTNGKAVGDRQVFKRIIPLVDSDPALRDEFYWQLVKQTNACPSPVILLHICELILFASCVYPVSQESYCHLVAQFCLLYYNGTPEIKNLMLLTLIHLQTRRWEYEKIDHHIGGYVDKMLTGMGRTNSLFGVSLYAMMDFQSKKYPNMPLPMVLFGIIRRLVDKNALGTEGVFIEKGNEGLKNEIIGELRQGKMDALDRGDVHVLANVLKDWLEALPNSLIPSEVANNFVIEGREGKFLGFTETLPGPHKHSLLCLIGFLQEIHRNSSFTHVGKKELGENIGPLLIREGHGPNPVPRYRNMGIVFLQRMIDSGDTSVVYPLDQWYLETDLQ